MRFEVRTNVLVINRQIVLELAFISRRYPLAEFFGAVGRANLMPFAFVPNHAIGAIMIRGSRFGA